MSKMLKNYAGPQSLLLSSEQSQVLAVHLSTRTVTDRGSSFWWWRSSSLRFSSNQQSPWSLSWSWWTTVCWGIWGKWGIFFVCFLLRECPGCSDWSTFSIHPSQLRKSGIESVPFPNSKTRTLWMISSSTSGSRFRSIGGMSRSIFHRNRHFFSGRKEVKQNINGKALRQLCNSISFFQLNDNTYIGLEASPIRTPSVPLDGIFGSPFRIPVARGFRRGPVDVDPTLLRNTPVDFGISNPHLSNRRSKTWREVDNICNINTHGNSIESVVDGETKAIWTGIFCRISISWSILMLIKVVCTDLVKSVGIRSLTLHIAAYLQHTNKKIVIFSNLLKMHGNLKRYEKIMMQLHAAADVQHSDHFAAY